MFALTTGGLSGPFDTVAARHNLIENLNPAWDATWKFGYGPT